MKRLALFAPILAAAALLGPAAPASPAGEALPTGVHRITLTPARDPLACRTAAAAHPSFATPQELHAFATTGPCAPALSTQTASSSSAFTLLSCTIGFGHGVEDLGLLYNIYTDTFGFCSGKGTVVVTCYDVAAIADAAPPVEAMADANIGGCDAQTPLQELPKAVVVPAVQAGLVIAVDTAGNVGVREGFGTFPA